MAVATAIDFGEKPDHSDSDALLVTRAQRELPGPSTAFDALVRRHRARIERRAAAILGGRAEAEDAAAGWPDVDVAAKSAAAQVIGQAKLTADILTWLRSATDELNGDALAVIMTGMGRDGLAGCERLKHAGGYIFAQHQDDCVVYGMPKAVIEANLADRILPLAKIAPAVVRHVKRSRRG